MCARKSKLMRACNCCWWLPQLRKSGKTEKTKWPKSSMVWNSAEKNQHLLFIWVCQSYRFLMVSQCEFLCAFVSLHFKCHMSPSVTGIFGMKAGFWQHAARMYSRSWDDASSYVAKAILGTRKSQYKWTPEKQFPSRSCWCLLWQNEMSQCRQTKAPDK